MEPPFLLIEPGRSIVGDAGLTLYRVGSVKRIEESAPVSPWTAAWATTRAIPCTARPMTW